MFDPTFDDWYKPRTEKWGTDPLYVFFSGSESDSEGGRASPFDSRLHFSPGWKATGTFDG